MIKPKCIPMARAIIVMGLLLLMPALMLSSAVQVKATHVSATWGAITYQPVDEHTYMSDVCDYINRTVFGGRGASWACNNFYYQYTTASNVYQMLDLVEDYSTYDYMATWHVGNYVPLHIYGGYWEITGWYWDEIYQQWFPIWDWIETGPTLHYGYYQSDNTNDYIKDCNLYGHSGPKERFTFIWTCVNAGFYWDNNLNFYINGDQTKYGYIDTQNGTGVVGVPYGWTSQGNLRKDGYGNPDTSSNYCYISFENRDKDLKQHWNDNAQNNNHYSNFVKKFYDYAVTARTYTINQALDRATNDMGNLTETSFSLSHLYQGYTAVDAPGLTCRMRVLGNGNQQIP